MQEYTVIDIHSDKLPVYKMNDPNYLIATSYPSPHYSLVESKYSEMQTFGIVMSTIMLIVGLSVDRHLLWYSLMTFSTVKIVFQVSKLAKDKDIFDRQDVKRFCQTCMYGVFIVLLWHTDKKYI